MGAPKKGVLPFRCHPSFSAFLLLGAEYSPLPQGPITEAYSPDSLGLKHSKPCAKINLNSSHLFQEFECTDAQLTNIAAKQFREGRNLKNKK